ncbi:hypothetical protein HDU84_004556 [Entophlyctis sp. JEL0112]|nr:hypothetical protein HDU84_004556 [Entophlyctis sp. JEL0112]
MSIHNYCSSGNSSCWPSASTWAAFNSSIGGRLATVTPWASPCFLSNYNSGACTEVINSYYDEFSRVNQTGATAATNWEACGSNNCWLYHLTPEITAFRSCSLGRLSPFVVALETATAAVDVAAAIQFATAHNIKLVIKNTGHCYLGRSVAKDSLTLWTHNLKSKIFSSATTICGVTSPSVTIGAGVQANEAYDLAAANNHMFIGGHYPSVGVGGGFVLGGGHGPLAPAKGFAVDQVLQVEIVTPDGQLRTLNACSADADLFWAIRGGGGGSWGVVTKTTFKVYPEEPVHLVTLNANYTALGVLQIDSIVTSFLTTVASNQLKWGSLGGAGKVFLFDYGFRSVSEGRFYQPNLTFVDFESLYAPILNFNTTWTNELTYYGVNVTAFPKFHDYLNDFLVPLASLEAVGYWTHLSSRIVPKRLFTNSSTVSTMVTALVKGAVKMNAPFNEPDAQNATSVHPAWRSAAWQVIYTCGATAEVPSSIRTYLANNVYAATQPLIDITPDTGAYYNEASQQQEDWENAFWGNNYARLLAVKEKYDPQGIFTVYKGIDVRMVLKRSNSIGNGDGVDGASPPGRRQRLLPDVSSDSLSPRVASATAPAKMILFGEHAVVYKGRRALACSVDLTTTVTITASQPDDLACPDGGGCLKIALPEVGIPESEPLFVPATLLHSCRLPDAITPALICTPDQIAVVEAMIDAVVPQSRQLTGMPKRAVCALLSLYLGITRSINQFADPTAAAKTTAISTTSRIPTGSGLGSSASFCVALAAALLLHARHPRLLAAAHRGGDQRDETVYDADTRAIVNEWALCGETVLHGLVSGVDNTVVCFGGANVFVKGMPLVPISGFPAVRMLITNTGVGKDTKKQVGIVTQRMEKMKNVTERLVDAVDAIVGECCALFEDFDGGRVGMDQVYDKLELLFELNHGILSALGVSHPSLEKIVAITRNYGLFTKMTGAGGGGCAITLIPEGFDNDRLRRAVAELEKEGFSCFESCVGCDGVSMKLDDEAATNFASSMMATFRTLYTTSQYSDVCVNVMGHTFRLHRAVISANPYFESMLSGKWQESGKQTLQLEFDDPVINLDAVKTVIARMYGIFGQPVTHSNVFALLATSSFFGDSALTQLCIVHVTATLTPATTPKYLAFADANFHGVHTTAVTNACLVHLCRLAGDPRFRSDYVSCLRAVPARWRETVLRADWLFVEDEVARMAVIEDVYDGFDGEIHADDKRAEASGNESDVNASVDGNDGGLDATDTHATHSRFDSETSIHTLFGNGWSAREHGSNEAVPYSESSLAAAEKASAIADVLSVVTENAAVLPTVQDVLSSAVIFSNINFATLLSVQARHRAAAAAIQRGLWQQQDLRAMIVASTPTTVNLGISYQHDAGDDGDNAHPGNRTSATPAQDTETMDGYSRVVDLIKTPSNWNSMRFPPFRFGYAFTGKQLGTIQENYGVKVYSNQQFYGFVYFSLIFTYLFISTEYEPGGSMWQIYLQKLEGEEGPALGIYMQRLPFEEPSFSTDISEYADKRIQVKLWFQIVCYTADSCCILESKPDLFKLTQSWGWRSTKMYSDIFEDPELEFKCVVVMGQT